MDSTHHVVIVGAGFGGRDAAKRLARLLPPRFRITLVDRNDYLLYTPMLTEAAGRSVSPAHIVAPTRDLSRRIVFVQSEVLSANLHEKTVTLEDGQTLYADHILLALGSTTNFRHIPGAKENSLTMKTLEDARRVRTLAERRVHQAYAEQDQQERKRLLTFAVAGGGYTGVETIAALNDLVRDSAAEYGIAQDEIQMVLIEPTQRLMAEMPETLATYALHRMQQDGIRVETGIGVQSVEPGLLALSSGERIPVGLLIWDAGIEPNPLLQSIGCPRGKKGGVTVDSAFRVADTPGIWAIGDCAEIPKPDGSGSFYEPTAQNATREGQHVANNIVSSIRGLKVKPFRYKQVGELALISRRRGVAHVFGFQISGIAAWLLWRGVYLAKMPSMRQRFKILGDWLRLAFGRQYVPVTRRLQPPHVPPAYATSKAGFPG